MAMFDVISLINLFGLPGLFITTLLAASIVPFPSEPAIVLTAAIFNPVLVFVVALAGAAIGSVTNYYIGWKGLRHHFLRRSPKYEKKARKIFKKWGAFVLLFAPWI